MEKILITGVAGFIASHVASRFVREGFTVVGVDDLSSGRIENVPPGISFIHGDLALESTFDLIPSDCQKILHLAGQSSGEISFDNPVLDLEKNTVSTVNLIQYGIKNKVDRIVYASSMSVYGAVDGKAIEDKTIPSPLSCYGVGKLASEGYLRAYSSMLPFVVMRMFNVYGPGQDMSNLRQGMVSIYLAQAMREGRIQVKGSLERFRDFIFIDDVVEAWYRATFHAAAVGEVLNVGTGIKTSVGNLIQKICQIVPQSEYFISGSTPGDQLGIYADSLKIRERLKIKSFTSLDEGLKIFVEWVQSTTH